MPTRLRLIMTWLLLAALPWQGVAAAAMVICQPATHQTTSAAQHAPLVSPSSQAGHHDHAHEHMQDTPGSGDAGLHATVQGAVPADGHGLQADADHHCAACSMCGHALALTDGAVTLAAQPAPQGMVADAASHLASRVAPIPDKPPRA